MQRTQRTSRRVGVGAFRGEARNSKRRFLGSQLACTEALQGRAAPAAGSILQSTDSRSPRWAASARLCALARGIRPALLQTRRVPGPAAFLDAATLAVDFHILTIVEYI